MHPHNPCTREANAACLEVHVSEVFNRFIMRLEAAKGVEPDVFKHTQLLRSSTLGVEITYSGLRFNLIG